MCGGRKAGGGCVSSVGRVGSGRRLASTRTEVETKEHEPQEGGWLPHPQAGVTAGWACLCRSHCIRKALPTTPTYRLTTAHPPAYSQRKSSRAGRDSDFKTTAPAGHLLPIPYLSTPTPSLVPTLSSAPADNSCSDSPEPSPLVGSDPSHLHPYYSSHSVAFSSGSHGTPGARTGHTFIDSLKWSHV